MATWEKGEKHEELIQKEEMMLRTTFSVAAVMELAEVMAYLARSTATANLFSVPFSEFDKSRQEEKAETEMGEGEDISACRLRLPQATATGESYTQHPFQSLQLLPPQAMPTCSNKVTYTLFRPLFRCMARFSRSPLSRLLCCRGSFCCYSSLYLIHSPIAVQQLQAPHLHACSSSIPFSS